MNGRISNLTREWKLYVLLVGMVLIAGYLFHIDGKIEKISGRLEEVSSTLGSIEGISTGTDYTLQQIETRVAGIETQVNTIAQRVKRRKK